MLQQDPMLRALAFAAAIAAGGMFACELSTPGITAAAPADSQCLTPAAEDELAGDDDAAASAISITTDGGADATGVGDDAAVGIQTTGPGPVCATSP